MRLLHTTDFTFKESFDERWLFSKEPDCANYAILSHQWEGDEITYKQFSKERQKYASGGAFRKAYEFDKTGHPGLWKIVQASLCARRRQYVWIWIDTCCIDRRSSAELTESINSMFGWYRKAAMCFGYLSDVNHRDEMHDSRWHKRGWCLQELLAPRAMIFLDSRWQKIANRHELKDQIVRATGIGTQYLPGLTTEESVPMWMAACVANKMSWMSNRQTTRKEDMAYALLGLFDVNMPLLYGEGNKAFLRLQLEVLKRSDDESLFAWQRPQSATDDITELLERYIPWRLTTPSASGMLAATIEWFRNGGNLALPSSGQFVERLPYSMTNKGLEFRCLIRNWRPAADDQPGTVAVIPLNCVNAPDGKVTASSRRVQISLKRRGHDDVRSGWIRGHDPSTNSVDGERYLDHSTGGVIVRDEGKLIDGEALAKLDLKTEETLVTFYIPQPDM